VRVTPTIATRGPRVAPEPRLLPGWAALSLGELAARENAMTSKSIPRKECLALAHRVSGGDPAYVNWVGKDQGDKTYDRYFDNLHALARGLARELEKAGHIVCDPSGGYRLANPNDGRFEQLKKKLESDWLPKAQELSLVEYLENRFLAERGEIRREEIEQISLALVDTDAAHRANGSDTAGMKQKKGGRIGRKPNPLWDVCRQDALAHLKEKGAPRPDDDDRFWRTQADFERWILNWWTRNLPNDAKQPSESSAREYAAQWLGEFEEGKKGQ